MICRSIRLRPFPRVGQHPPKRPETAEGAVGVLFEQQKIVVANVIELFLELFDRGNVGGQVRVAPPLGFDRALLQLVFASAFEFRHRLAR